jgi:hypothetical protein
MDILKGPKMLKGNKSQNSKKKTEMLKGNKEGQTNLGPLW